MAQPPMTEHAKALREEQELALIKTKPYETNTETQAPWKAAHSFDYNSLPTLYKELVNKIRQLPGYKLGTVRDFTLDYRDDSYFKFDPHKTPGLDGATVFMLTLESDGVITFIPPDRDIYRRANMDEISKYSYTDQDLDVLHKRGDLLCLSDIAREKLDWSIRLGIDGKTKSLKQIVKSKYVSRKIEEDEENTEDDYGYIEENDELYGCVVVENEDIVRDMNHDETNYMLCDWWG
eukprot:735411_1